MVLGAVGCSAVPPGNTFPFFIAETGVPGGAAVLAIAVLLAVGAGTVGRGKAEEAVEGEDEIGGAALLAPTG